MFNFKKYYIWYLIILLNLLCVSAFTQEKYALVIGNGNYISVSKLKNPVNDASDMEFVLKRLGFQVELLTDASLDKMESAVVRLGNKLGQSQDSYGFFYYAGHGIQSNGVNYLIPSDANIVSESFLKTKALPAQSVLDTLQQASNGLNIVVLDACRDNPYSWARSSNRGLSVMGTQPPGSIIVYSTSAGSIAQDGESRNGLFTEYLLKNITLPGLEIKEVFNRTGADVMLASNNKQIPAVYNQCFSSSFLAGMEAQITNKPIDPAELKVVTGIVTIILASSGTVEFNGISRNIQNNGSASVYDLAPGNYSIKVIYKDGHIELRSIYIEPNTNTTVTFNYKPGTLEGNIATKYEINSIGMTMIKIPGGRYFMGSTIGIIEEMPMHQVNINDFYISMTEVTQEQWIIIMGTNPSWVYQNRKTDMTCPVNQITWYDGAEFCNELSVLEGLIPVYSITDIERTNDYHIIEAIVSAEFNNNGYRLPTEAEWEYAAKGKEKELSRIQTYAGSDNIDEVACYNKNSHDLTASNPNYGDHPVAQMKPNSFGLYDMSGNLYEWCWDWQTPYIRTLQNNPTGNSTGTSRTIRGGSWVRDYNASRTTSRAFADPKYIAPEIGFRVVRSGNLNDQ